MSGFTALLMNESNFIAVNIIYIKLFVKTTKRFQRMHYVLVKVCKIKPN